MKLRTQILGLMTVAAIPALVYATPAKAAEDVNKAADSIVITKTTYSYDKNNDGFIDPSEFTTYITRSTDINGDGFLENKEYEDGSMTYFYNNMKAEATDPADVKSYTYWDKDKDNRLDSNEVSTLVANTGIYKKWDTNHDDRIDHDEFAIGTFHSYDTNNDGVINVKEWNQVIM